MNWNGAFDGKVAIVTAAAVGIGEAAARRLAAGGAKLALADLNGPGVEQLAAELRGQGAEALPIRVDAMRGAEVEAMVEQTVARFGGLDVLVNGVGGWLERPGQTVRETTEDEWSHHLALQVTPAFLCSKAVIPHLIARGGGRIVNVGSIVARGQFYFSSPPYAAGKAALHALTRYLAQELGPHGITVNVVAPGPIYSPRTRGSLVGERAERIKSMTPTGRIGETDDVADVIAFLASDAARHITGATVDVNGGYLMV